MVLRSVEMDNGDCVLDCLQPILIGCLAFVCLVNLDSGLEFRYDAV